MSGYADVEWGKGWSFFVGAIARDISEVLAALCTTLEPNETKGVSRDLLMTDSRIYT